MSTELINRRTDWDFVEIPEDADIQIENARLLRASQLESGDKVIDCSWRVATVKSSTWETVAFLTLTKEECDQFDKIYDLPEDEQKKVFEELFGNKTIEYRLLDVEIFDTAGLVHSFIHCCHFEDEHAEFYPDIALT